MSKGNIIFYGFLINCILFVFTWTGFAIAFGKAYAKMISEMNNNTSDIRDLKRDIKLPDGETRFLSKLDYQNNEAKSKELSDERFGSLKGELEKQSAMLDTILKAVRLKTG